MSATLSTMGMSRKPIAVDLYCGLFGWGEALAECGYFVVGVDIEDMCGKFGLPRPEGCHLVIQDVLTLHGSQFKHAALIVASPPCQAYSWRAMPWKAAKAAPAPDNTLFEACFRIQHEACEAAGHHIPMVVENVRGAQKWVGRARWHYGSYFLWGDVPALMPPARNAFKSADIKNGGGSWFNVAHNTTSGRGNNPDGRKFTLRKCGDKSTPRDPVAAAHGIKRAFASAMIAKIPFELGRHIAAVYRPRQREAA